MTNDRRRVLAVTSTFPRWPGDTTTPFILHLAQDLRALGWAIDVLAPHAPAAARNEILEGVPVQRFRYLWPASLQTVCYAGGALANLDRHPGNAAKLPFLVLAELGAIAARLSSNRYALVHSHWILPQGFTAALATRHARVPHLLTVHGSDVLALNAPVLRWFKRAALRGAEAVTANSSATEQAVCDLGVPGLTLERIPMGVAEPVLDARRQQRALDLRRRYRRAAGPLLLFIGRLAEEKGWRDLLHAMALLRAAGSGATLLMLGDGPEHADAAAMIAGLGLGDRVALLGWIDHGEIDSYLAAADVLVAPSCRTASGRTEGQGLALAEAMMAGRPVIASRVGGVGDFVRHGETGWLVAERDPPALAAAVQGLQDDPALARRMGAAAQLYASRHLSRAQTAHAFDRLYARLTAADKPAKVTVS
jgi:glycosyltransferase involved in cell wall biosynthesis